MRRRKFEIRSSKFEKKGEWMGALTQAGALRGAVGLGPVHTNQNQPEKMEIREFLSAD
jgi:hypothetical protein